MASATAMASRRHWTSTPRAAPPRRTPRRLSISSAGLPPEGNLDDHVRRLHDADGLVADLQAHLVDGFGGHQADHPVRPRDHFDDGRHAVLLDAGDDAREAVA